MFATARWGAVGEFAASRHGVVTRKQAAELGVRKNSVARLIDAGHLTEPLPGVLVVVGSVDTWRRKLMIATLGSRAVGVGGFRSAAALHACDNYEPGPVELVVPNWRASLASVASLHRGVLHPSDITTVDGIRCTGIARTLCDIAGVDPFETVRAAFESMWRAGKSLLWIRQTAERLDRPGPCGSKVILRLLDDAARRTQVTGSALELELEAILEGVVDLVRQYEIRDESGNFIARPDFSVVEARLALEAHSREHHFGPTAEDSDHAREHRMKRVGWDVMYFGSSNLADPDRVRADVLAVVNRRLADRTAGGVKAGF